MKFEDIANSTPLLILSESTISSIIKDAVSVGFLTLLIYVNHIYGAASTAVDITGVVLFWLLMCRFLFAEEKVLRLTKKQLAAWARSGFPDIEQEAEQ